MKIIRKIIEIDDELCDGCGQCVPECAEGALQIIDGKARVMAEKYCDGLGACLGTCPKGALKIVEREAEEFDEAAVEAHVESQKPMACGCPSSNIMTFVPSQTNNIEKTENIDSALSHWPVQIRLIPPDAPFLKNAHVLVLADCAAVSFPNLHQKLIDGKVVMMGCPKFDDAQAYEDKFAVMFEKAGIRRITIAYMEVPCCSGLPAIVKNAMTKTKTFIPVESIIITRKGGLKIKN